MLKRILLLVFSIQFLQASGQADFSDVTESVSINPFESAHTYGSGVCAVDSDNDGDIDLYILSNEQSKNQYFSNDGDGKFTSISNALDIDMRSRTALWFDYDGDHLLDVMVAGDCSFSDLSCVDVDNLRLFRQSNVNSFDDHTSSSDLLWGRGIAGVFGGLAAGDFDNDGYLDLVTTQWGGEIKLMRNQRDGTFEDITVSAGLDKLSKYWQPLLFDMDQDGWMDIYLTVDNQPNLYYRNNQDGTFHEIAIPINLDNDHNDMGIALGDFDNDEDFDIYITNIERDEPGSHNALFRNDLQSGSFTFNEISKSHTLNAGGWGWGCTFLDANNDGFLDLAATNGWVSDFNDQSKFWRNNGSTFQDLSHEVGFDDTLQATTLISFDMDRDGDLDMAQTLKDNPDQLIAFRLLENKLNESAEMGNYLVVKPRMLGTNHWAIGSTVRITTSTGVQSRPITAGISFYGQEPAEAHFGLGDVMSIEKVEVIWPGGKSFILENVAANQIIIINDKDALHTPGGIVAIAESSTEIRVDWGHMTSSETGYLIERSINPNFDEVNPFLVGDVHTFQDTGLEAFTTYYYRIKAKNGTFESEYSQSGSVRTASDVVIDAPASLLINLLSETSVALTWQDVANNEQGYTVQRSLFEDFNSYFVFDMAANSTELSDDNIEPYTTYYYRVQAYREDGQSDFSNTVMVETVVLGQVELETNEAMVFSTQPGIFNISLPSFKTKSQLSMINTSGQCIAKWTFANSTELVDFQFPMPQKQGVYFVLIETDHEVWRFKILNR